MKKIIQKYQKELGYAIVIIIVSFYGGVKYDQSKNVAISPANFSTQNGQGRTGAQRGMRAGGGNTMGQIVAKDATSITVEMRGSGSKIVFYSGTTPVLKSAPGSLDDLKVGETISVNGTANPDGSITAQSVQIRPTPPVGVAK